MAGPFGLGRGVGTSGHGPVDCGMGFRHRADRAQPVAGLGGGRASPRWWAWPALAWPCANGWGFRRLARLDDLRQQADRARNDGNRNTALRLMARLSALYANRPEMRWHRDRLAELAPDQPDAEGLLHLSETTLLVPLDQAARAEVEAAARQVALLTAMLPMALVDVVAALAINLRMIRRIAEIYGGARRCARQHPLATRCGGASVGHRCRGGGRRYAGICRLWRRGVEIVAPLWRRVGERRADRAAGHCRHEHLPPPALRRCAKAAHQQYSVARNQRLV